MSFGFSVGDCILLIDIARTQYNNCVAAGTEYQEISRDIKTLSNVLELLHDESSKASSPLQHGDRAFATQLAPAVNGCKHILEDLQTLLASYEGLSGNKAVNPTRKLWHKIRFGSKRQALGEVRGKIVFYTTTISVLLDTLQLRATGRLEDKLDATSTAMMDAFQSMKLAMVEEALKAKSVSRQQSTASLLSMSTYNEDDKEVWREFRRQLISKGFKSNQLDRHSDMLQSYLLKLEQSGVLDEVEALEAVQQKHVFNTFTDVAENLQPIEEEDQLIGTPPVHQELPFRTVASRNAGPEPSPPPKDEEGTVKASATLEPNTSTFLHTIISHAVSQGPEALQQALNLYPQLLQDPYLEAAISSELIPSVRESLQAIVTTAVQETSGESEENWSKSGNSPQSVRERMPESGTMIEMNTTKDNAIGMTQDLCPELGAERIPSPEYSFVRPKTCSRCAEPNIQFDLHYNCQKCSNGNWNICLNCYRSGKGCLYWFGFGSAAWVKWRELNYSGDLFAENEQPHKLIPRRFSPNVELPSGHMLPRLETGMFCSNCLAWANSCYYQCDLCNRGDWGFCFDCVNQGKCCTHPLLPIADSSWNMKWMAQHTPTSASFSTTARISPHGAFLPLTLKVKCDVCCQYIQTLAPRFHCFSCTSSNLCSRESPGDCDICYSCYIELEKTGRLSPENGQKGWRRCLQGHRMIVVKFEDAPDGQRRVILNDLVGGRRLREEPLQSNPGFNLERWSWSDGAKWRHVDRDVSLSPPNLGGDTTEFPPDGGVGTSSRAIWSWFPREGITDELLFPAWAEVTEIVNINDDWSLGVYMGRSGLFPAPYLNDQPYGKVKEPLR